MAPESCTAVADVQGYSVVPCSQRRVMVCYAGYGSDRVRRRAKNDSSFSSSASGAKYIGSHLGAQQLSQVAEAAVGWLSSAATAAQAALPAAANGLTTTCLRECRLQSTLCCRVVCNRQQALPVDGCMARCTLVRTRTRAVQ